MDYQGNYIASIEAITNWDNIADFDAIGIAVTTQAANCITTVSCAGNATITYGQAITRRGFCYKAGSSGDPTVSDSIVYEDGAFSLGAYSLAISGLTASTDYRVRAYIYNSTLGVIYGDTVQLYTPSWSFNANFVAQKDRRADGPAPINLLSFGFAFPVYLSDRDVTPSGGPLYKGLVKSWGFVDSSIVQTPGSGLIGTIEISDLQVTIINSTSPRFSDNFSIDDPPENVTVTLYQWFKGLADADKEVIFKGILYGQPRYDEYTCTLTLRGIISKYDVKIGDDLILSASDYPGIDPDDVGKMQNIIYGSAENVPCQALEAGSADSLADDIDETQTSIELSDATYIASSGVLGCDEEQITYTGKSGNTLTGCTRGYNSTTATSHSGGAAAWEILSRYVYEIAGHPVKSIGDIFVDGRRITAICTKYTGQSGNELTGYEGKAVFTVPSKLNRKQAISLIVNDGIVINDGVDVDSSLEIADGITISDAIEILDTIDVNDGITVSDTIAVSDTVGVSQGSHSHSSASSAASVVWKFESTAVVSGTWTNPGNIIDGDLSSYGEQSYGSANCDLTVSKSYYESYVGSPSRIRACIRVKQLGNNSDNSITFSFGGSTATIPYNTTDTTVKGSWTAVGTTYDTWDKINSATGTLRDYHRTTANSQIYEVWAEIEFAPSGTSSNAASGVSKTGSATKTGSADKNGTVTLTGGVSKSGTVTRGGSVALNGGVTKTGSVSRSGVVSLSGNSVADVRIGTLVTCNVQGYQDDSAGTYTGTPYALIERPDHVFKHIWAVQMGASLSDLIGYTLTASGAFYASYNYSFSLCLRQPIQASSLLMRLAFQCRSRFIVLPNGKAKLLVRQTGQVSRHSIVKNEIKLDSVYVERSPSTEILNVFNLYYYLDNTCDSTDPASYWSAAKFTDTDSIARYGKRTWQGSTDILCMDAVSSESMAVHVGEYYREYHGRARRMPHIGMFLDNLEVQSGDIIDITHPLDNMSGFVVEVQKIQHHIGNLSQVDWLEVLTVENGI